MGCYTVKMTAFGYRPFYRDSLCFQPLHPHQELGSIAMQQDDALLKKVEIVHQREVVQLQTDKKVFNVEKQLTAQGGTALDALENVPSVTVDMNGNVSLRGSANVTVLIDGKPSAITGGGRQAALAAIPASSIETITVITQPSAKYDPDGMSGIIDIVLKKNKVKGLNGAVDVSLENGIHPDSLAAYASMLGINYTLSTNLAYRNDRFNVYGGYSRNHYEGYRGFTQTNETWFGTYDRLEQNRTGTHLRQSDLIKVGAELYPSQRSTLGVTCNVNLGVNDRTGNMVYDAFNDTGQYDRWRRISDDHSNREGYDLEGSYRQTFKEKGPQLDALVQHSSGRGTAEGRYTENELDWTGGTAAMPHNLKQYVQTDNGSHLSTFQVDYRHPLSEKGKVATGLKTTRRDLREAYYQATNGESDDSLNNTFDYEEYVHAAYGILEGDYRKLHYQAGLRLEQVFVEGQLLQTPTPYTNRYFSAYPSLHIRRTLNETDELSLSYARRVNRPPTRSLNPFARFTDPLNLRKGNPELRPEYTNSVEWGYHARREKWTMTAAVYYRYMTDLIRRVKRIDTSGVATVSWQNLDNGHLYGFEGVVNWRPSTQWKVMLTANVARVLLNGTSGEAELNNAGWNGSARLQSTWTIKESVTAQLSGYYRLPIVLAQGLSDPMYGLDAAVKYTFFDAKMYLNVKCSDVFNTRFFAYENREENTFVSRGKWKWQSRRILLALGYRFGKTQPDKKRRKGRGQPTGGDFGM